MKILVCGGRDYNNYSKVNEILSLICEENNLKTEPDSFGNYLYTPTIIHGAAKGADSLADQWAVANWTKLEVYPAKWSKWGKAAGYMRNKQMLEEGKPDLVVAFPGGKGTAMMVKIAKEAGVKVIEIQDGQGIPQT
jgi:hypothetical protein